MAEPNFIKAYKGRTCDHPDHDAIARSRADKIYLKKVKPRLEAAELVENDEDLFSSEIHLEEAVLATADYTYWRNHWSKIAWAALSRFPERQSIRLRDICKRFREIREAEYLVRPYSSMTRNEALNYLREIRTDVYRNARDFCPDVLKAIVNANEEQKELAWV